MLLPRLAANWPKKSEKGRGNGEEFATNAARVYVVQVEKVSGIVCALTWWKSFRATFGLPSSVVR